MQNLARYLSIIAHPFFLLPVVVIISLADDRFNHLPRQTIISAMLLFVIAIAAFSWWRVRRGRWQHIDASSGHERRDLLRFALPILLLLTVYSWWQSGWSPWTRSNTILFLVLLIAAMLRRWRHVSLHVTFAAVAAAIASQSSWILMTVTAAMTLLLCWSRLYLKRHRRSEVLLGLLLGTLAGYLIVS